MGLFRNKSEGTALFTELTTARHTDLDDTEQPSSARSAPQLEDNRATLEPSTSEQQGRAISAPELGKPIAQIDELTQAQKRTLAHIQMLSKVMDHAVTIPIIKKKFGLDAMLGLIPYAGDVAGATVGSYIISRALKYNLPKRLVLRMLINQAIDSCVGVIPFFGDLFDFGFKANARNVKLLQEHLQHPKQAKKADTCFLCSMFFLVVVLPIILVVGVVAAIVVGILAAVGRLG